MKGFTKAEKYAFRISLRHRGKVTSLEVARLPNPLHRAARKEFRNARWYRSAYEDVWLYDAQA